MTSGWKRRAALLGLFTLLCVLVAALGWRRTAWQVWAVGLCAGLEAFVIADVVKDVRACLARGERGQAAASLLNGVFASAFVLLLAGLLLTSEIGGRS
jgi:hypothetical protein